MRGIRVARLLMGRNDQTLLHVGQLEIGLDVHCRVPALVRAPSRAPFTSRRS
jgi:hypothetical protein